MIKNRLTNRINALHNQATDSREKLIKMATSNSLIDAFSQVKFSDAAASESALAAMQYSHDFVNNKIEGNCLSDFTDEQITETCQEILDGINRQINSNITISMDTTKVNVLNGLNRAREAMCNVLDLPMY